jgi:hypothetical protein
MRGRDPAVVLSVACDIAVVLRNELRGARRSDSREGGNRTRVPLNQISYLARFSVPQRCLTDFRLAARALRLSEALAHARRLVVVTGVLRVTSGGPSRSRSAEPRWKQTPPDLSPLPHTGRSHALHLPRPTTQALIGKRGCVFGNVR